MTPREKVLRDALRRILACPLNTFGYAEEVRGLASQALAAADAIPDAPYVPKRIVGRKIVQAIPDAPVYYSQEGNVISGSEEAPGCKPVPSRAELIELMCVTSGFGGDWMALVLDALIKAGVVKP